METKEETKKQSSPKRRNKVDEQKPKSKTRLFWETYYPDGSRGEIYNMRAVLR
jgi:hypothetical protein